MRSISSTMILDQDGISYVRMGLGNLDRLTWSLSRWQRSGNNKDLAARKLLASLGMFRREVNFVSRVTLRYLTEVFQGER